MNAGVKRHLLTRSGMTSFGPIQAGSSSTADTLDHLPTDFARHVLAMVLHPIPYRYTSHRAGTWPTRQRGRPVKELSQSIVDMQAIDDALSRMRAGLEAVGKMPMWKASMDSADRSAAESAIAEVIALAPILLGEVQRLRVECDASLLGEFTRSQLIESLLAEIDAWKVRDPARLPHLAAALTALRGISSASAPLAESKVRTVKCGSEPSNAMARHFALESAAFKAWCDGREAIDSYRGDAAPGAVIGIGSFIRSDAPVPSEAPSQPDDYCGRCEGRIAWLLRIVAEASNATSYESPLMREVERLARADLAQADGCWG